ncbi:hypothetical protein KCU73_g10686, partial [Aureobasidium melanogenum]
MANFSPDQDTESNFDNDDDESRSDIQSLCQALPTEVDIFTATSQKPSFLDFKTNLENVRLKCTIGPPPVLLYLPDDTSSTPTITAFFQIITELLSIAQGEYESSGAPARAADSVNSLYQTTMTGSLDARNRDPERFLYGVWPPMFELLQQIPTGHHAIQRLVDFVAELKKIQVETLQIWGHNTRLWSYLPLFAPEFAEQVEQDTVDYGKSSLKAFRDLLEADGICTLFNYSKTSSRTA